MANGKTDLLPCPFCGESPWNIRVRDTKKAKLNPGVHFDDFRVIVVQCLHCYATVGFYSPDRCGSVKNARKDAINAWNRRAKKIVHGHWIEKEKIVYGMPPNCFFECSECGTEYESIFMAACCADIAGDGTKFPICPCCGAKMDGEIELTESRGRWMNKDTPITVTLRKIEWTHVLAAITEIKHDTRRSALVRQKYGEVGRAIREQIEQSAKETKQ